MDNWEIKVEKKKKILDTKSKYSLILFKRIWLIFRPGNHISKYAQLAQEIDSVNQKRTNDDSKESRKNKEWEQTLLRKTCIYYCFPYKQIVPCCFFWSIWWNNSSHFFLVSKGNNVNMAFIHILQVSLWSYSSSWIHLNKFFSINQNQEFSGKY